MPGKSFKACAYLHCPVLTKDTYCDKHSKEVHKEYKKNRNDKREQKFYSSKAWINLRNVKRQMNPLCEICMTKDKLTPVDIVHHIVEVKEDWSLRLTLSNLQSVCVSCHQSIHRTKQ